MLSRRRPLRQAAPVMAVLGLLAVSACGTRQSDQAIKDAAGGSTQLASVEQSQGGTAGGGTTGSTGTTGATGSTSSSGTTGTTGPAAGTTGASTSGSTGAKGTGGATGSSGASGTTGSADGPATGSPVTVAIVGTFSGPVGALVKDTTTGARIWAAYANAHGGVNGHKVNLVIGDDGGDPARYNSLVQQFVEQDHAIAFIYTTLGFAPNGNNRYLDSKKIFTFGTEGGLDNAYNDPYELTAVPSGHTYADAMIYAFSKIAKSKGTMKLAEYACSDFSLCDNFDAEWSNPKALKATGFTLVDRGRPSLTQPDFTTQCINAKNAGATAIIAALDTASLRRFAGDCARQNYRPLMGSADVVVTPSIADDKNMEGFVVGSKLASFKASAVPGIKKLEQALAQYAPGQKNSGGIAYGWLLGTFFQHAGKSLPANPTAADVGNGVYALKGDDLEGMTYPLSFTRGQPSPNKLCFGVTVVHSSAFQQGPGSALQCSPRPV